MITLLTTLNTTGSKGKALRWLRANPPSALFLDFPVYCEDHINRISEGVNLEVVLEEMKKEDLVKEPEDNQSFRAATPLLRALPLLGCRAYCYRDPIYHDFMRELMDELLLLTLRARLAGISAEAWGNAVREGVILGIKVAEREADYIAERASEESVCIDASEDVEACLRGKGLDVQRVIIDEPCRPLDILRTKIKEEIHSGVRVAEGEVARLVGEHLRFAKLVVDKDYEEAYEIWRRASSKG